MVVSRVLDEQEDWTRTGLFSLSRDTPKMRSGYLVHVAIYLQYIPIIEKCTKIPGHLLNQDSLCCPMGVYNRLRFPVRSIVVELT